MFRPTRHLLFSEGVGLEVMLPCFGGCVKEQRAGEQAAADWLEAAASTASHRLLSLEPPLSLGA